MGLITWRCTYIAAILTGHSAFYFSVPCRAWCPAAIITITTIIQPARIRTCSIIRHLTRCTIIQCRRHHVSLASPLPRTRSTPILIRRLIPLQLITRLTRHPAPRAQVKICYNFFFNYYYYYYRWWMKHDNDVFDSVFIILLYTTWYYPWQMKYL